jgi:hypothetical protein
MDGFQAFPGVLPVVPVEDDDGYPWRVHGYLFLFSISISI